MKILIVSSSFFKAEGSIAKGIASIMSEHDIYFFSTLEIKHRRQEFEYLLNHVDIVHWLFNVVNLTEPKLRKYFLSHDIPKLATVHHVGPTEMNKIKISENANVIHVVSNEWLDFVSERTSKMVIKASSGINPEDFNFIEPHLYKSGRLKIGMLGFISELDNRKRVDIALEVFENLKERNLEFEVVLQGVGWQDLISSLNEKGIPCSNYKETSGLDIFKFFEQFHVYLCTSDYEGGPLPVLEALHCGIPVISTNVGIARDALSFGGGGLCAKGDVKALSEKLIELKQDHHQYSTFSKQASKLASKFYWSNLEGEYSYLYEQTIKEWEHDNNRKWTMQSNTFDAEKQRSKELAHVYVQQAIQFLYSDQKKKGLKKLKQALLSPYVSRSRKWDLSKRSLIFMLSGRKN